VRQLGSRRCCHIGDGLDHCRRTTQFGIVTFVTAPNPATLVEQLAATLPRGTTAEQTRRLVRNAVRRARREGLPLTSQVLAVLASDECGRARHRLVGRH